MKPKKLLLLLLLFSIKVFAVDIGSDTTVTRFSTQQTLNDGDRVAGFAWLEEGFQFFDTTSTATWDTVYPVSGNIELNGSTLYLNQDLIISNTADIRTLGNIEGNGHTLYLAKTTTCIPSAKAFCDAVQLVQQGSENNGFRLYGMDWAYTSTLIATSGNGFSFGSTIEVFEFNGTTLSFTTSEAPVAAAASRTDTVRWSPTDLFLAAWTDLESSAGVSGTGRLDIYEYIPGGPNLVLRSSVTTVAQFLARFGIDWHPSGDYIATFNGTSTIEVYSVSATGVLSGAPVATYSPGLLSNGGSYALSWDPTGTYLAVQRSGGIIEIVEFNPGMGTLILNASILASTAYIDWNQNFANKLVATTIGGSTIKIYTHDGVGGTLTLEQDTVIAGGSGYKTPDLSPSGVCVCSGSEDNGFVFVFEVNPSDNETTLAFSEVPNGPTFEVRETRFAPNGKYFAHIDQGANPFVLPNPNVTVYQSTSEAFGVLADIVFTDLCIELDCNVKFQDCLFRFSGNCAINGNGKCLTLVDTTTFQIASNSSLLFKDIKVKGIHMGIIILTDETSTLSLKDVEWVQDADYTFSNGHFEVLDDWCLVGCDHTFAYQSTETSVIEDCGCMKLSYGFTFSYDPPTTSRDLLLMREETSKIFLDGATLHSTATGLRLTVGTLEYDGESFVSAEGTVESEAISFGDGTLISSDLKVIRALPAANLNIESGMVIHNFVN